MLFGVFRAPVIVEPFLEGEEGIFLPRLGLGALRFERPGFVS
jgi:hypothetical protein